MEFIDPKHRTGQTAIHYFFLSIISLNIETNWSSRSNLIKKAPQLKFFITKRPVLSSDTFLCNKCIVKY